MKALKNVHSFTDHPYIIHTISITIKIGPKHNTIYKKKPDIQYAPTLIYMWPRRVGQTAIQNTFPIQKTYIRNKTFTKMH